MTEVLYMDFSSHHPIQLVEEFFPLPEGARLRVVSYARYAAPKSPLAEICGLPFAQIAQDEAAPYKIGDKARYRDVCPVTRVMLRREINEALVESTAQLAEECGKSPDLIEEGISTDLGSHFIPALDLATCVGIAELPAAAGAIMQAFDRVAYAAGIEVPKTTTVAFFSTGNGFHADVDGLLPKQVRHSTFDGDKDLMETWVDACAATPYADQMWVQMSKKLPVRETRPYVLRWGPGVPGSGRTVPTLCCVFARRPVPPPEQCTSLTPTMTTIVALGMAKR